MNDMNELQFWYKVRAQFNKLHVDYTRVENIAGYGIPDVNCCHRGVEFWLEMKVLRSKRITMRPAQALWHFNRTAHGGRSFIVAIDKEEVIWVWGGDKAIDLNSNVFNLPEPDVKYTKPYPWDDMLTHFITREFRDRVSVTVGNESY